MAAGAIAAGLSLRVLKMVLQVSARKRDFEQLQQLLAAAEGEEERLLKCAEDDGVAYKAYIEARRSGSPSAPTALKQAIETPMMAARAAVAGIGFCRELAGLLEGAIRADVRGAAVLLLGSVRAILCSVDVNLSEVEDEAFASEMKEQRREIERQAVELSEEVLRCA